MADVHGVEIQVCSRPRADALGHRAHRYSRTASTQQAAAGVGVQLERGHPYHVRVAQKERGDTRNVVEIGVADAGVEEHGQRQAARAPDVLLAQRVQLRFRRVAAPLLRQIDVECDVLQSSGGKFSEQRAAGADAVGEKRRPQPRLARAPHDRRQLGARPQGGFAAGDLHIDTLAVLGADHVDAAVNLLEREVLQRLRRFGQVT